MVGSPANPNPEAPEFVVHDGEPGHMEVPKKDVSAQDEEQVSYLR